MEEKGAIEIKIDERGLRKKEKGASRASRGKTRFWIQPA
jgi:hypothetical protein